MGDNATIETRADANGATPEPKRRHGFTLIELVAILTILTVLAGMTIPVVSGTIAAQRVEACRERMRQQNLASDLPNQLQLPPASRP